MALGAITFTAGPAQALDRLREEAPGTSSPVSDNGWPIEAKADAGGSVWNRSVPGTPIVFEVRIGNVESIFSHLIRRYHYEVDMLREGDVVGFQLSSQVRDSSNHRSGTAVDIRPSWYPAGTSGGYSALQVKALNSILADYEGLVEWGGSANAMDESHFSIVVGPDDERLEHIAHRLEGWDDLPGQSIRAGV